MWLSVPGLEVLAVPGKKMRVWSVLLQWDLYCAETVVSHFAKIHSVYCQAVESLLSHTNHGYDCLWVW